MRSRYNPDSVNYQKDNVTSATSDSDVDPIDQMMAKLDAASKLIDKKMKDKEISNKDEIHAGGDNNRNYKENMNSTRTLSSKEVAAKYGKKDIIEYMIQSNIV